METGGFMDYDSKNCTVCGEYKFKGDFYPQKNTQDGLTCECKECRKKRSKKWGLENAERKKRNERSKKRDRREYNRLFKLRNPEYWKIYRQKKRLEKAQADYEKNLKKGA
jgi:hypothetical protein